MYIVADATNSLLVAMLLCTIFPVDCFGGAILRLLQAYVYNCWSKASLCPSSTGMFGVAAVYLEHKFMSDTVVHVVA